MFILFSLVTILVYAFFAVTFWQIKLHADPTQNRDWGLTFKIFIYLGGFCVMAVAICWMANVQDVLASFVALIATTASAFLAMRITETYDALEGESAEG